MTGTHLPLEVAMERLKVTKDVMEGLLCSGLLGYWTVAEGVVATSIESYERYGTQWGWPPREAPYAHMPEIPEGPQPVGMNYGGRISVKEVRHLIQQDYGWIAHFYLKPNSFYFPPQGGLSLIGPVPLRLAAPIDVPRSPLPTRLFPDAEGRLALITVSGIPRDCSNAFNEAYECATSALDQLAFDHDCALPICQAFVVRIPSGAIDVFFRKHPRDATLSAADLRMVGEHQELRAALALYREAISSNSPFHEFLGLWKVFENACGVRGAVGGVLGRFPENVEVERLPNAFAFVPYGGKSFEQVRRRLQPTYRVALAHGYLEDIKVLSAAFASDLHDVTVRLPIVRQMARGTMRNALAGLGQIRTGLVLRLIDVLDKRRSNLAAG